MRISEEEKAPVLSEVQVNPAATEHSYLAFFKRPLIYAIGFIWFAQLAGVTGIGFLMPIILKEAGLTDPFIIGTYTTLPYIASWIGVIWLSNRSDRHNERRWHYACALLVGAGGFVFTALAGDNLTLAMVGLIIATGATYSGTPLLWGIATSHFKRGEVCIGNRHDQLDGSTRRLCRPYDCGIPHLGVRNHRSGNDCLGRGFDSWGHRHYSIAKSRLI
ncbi:hypothetical protein CW358_03745 [Pseudomonas protegens]|nr:hypothetical protein CW358_03745 [Pseudomonas protegens]